MAVVTVQRFVEYGQVASFVAAVVKQRVTDFPELLSMASPARIRFVLDWLPFGCGVGIMKDPLSWP